MYAQNLTQGNQIQARWGRWSCINRTSRRFKQRSLPHTIRTSNKAAVRHCNAIQHVQQRGIVVLMATHEPKAWLDFFRFTSESKDGVVRARTDSSNSTGTTTKQSKLVWAHMVSTRQDSGLRNKRSALASWDLCKVATHFSEPQTQSPNLYKNLSCPYTGYIDPLIYPYIGQMAIAIYPYIGLIRGVLDAFPYPYIGHLLDIPLYTALIGE